MSIVDRKAAAIRQIAEHHVQNGKMNRVDVGRLLVRVGLEQIEQGAAHPSKAVDEFVAISDEMSRRVDAAWQQIQIQQGQSK